MMSVPAAHGGVVLGILPLATAAAAALLAHERPSRAFWLASAAGTVLVLTFMLRRSGGEAIAAGDVFLLGTVGVGAVGYTLSGRLSRHMPGWEVISWQVVILLPLAAAATLVQKAGGKILEISFFIELSFLKGREKLKGWPVRSLVAF